MLNQINFREALDNDKKLNKDGKLIRIHQPTD